ncbi:MAG TPA: glycosyltransferase family 39 protein [Pyrinomonadaceae bacterium]
MRLAAQAEPITTAGLRPELFTEPGALSLNRTALVIALVLLVVAGSGFRAVGLGREALSEDEINKLEAVADYRVHGLTAANSEHPFLMKALQTVSIVAAEKWNGSYLVAARPAQLRISTEAALRVPSIIFGALTVIVLYLVTAELFGGEIALITAALWAFDPAAISFNRIAKEDTFLLFFFLLANVFWLKSQRVAESKRNPEPLYWATAVSFGAMMASKYMPNFFAVSVCYYYIFQGIPQTRWRMGKKRFLIFFAVMGVTFLLLNPTILLPGTWRRMADFASYRRIGHDGYEFMGRVYTHKFTDWLSGVPWYFYFVFMLVKLPVATLASFFLGLPVVFRRRIGDGRFFLFFWMLIGFIPLALFGGKFTRYFAPLLPAVLIVASIGLQNIGRFVTQHLSAFAGNLRGKAYVRAGLYSIVILASVWASVWAAPHYRLYTNWLGGGVAGAGNYFPQDEFSDAAIRDTIVEIARRARPQARVATETVGLASYYAEQAGRADLQFVSLSDAEALKKLSDGDFIMAARGRRYFSNEALLKQLAQSAQPAFRVPLGEVPAVDVYVLDPPLRAIIESNAGTTDNKR